MKRLLWALLICMPLWGMEKITPPRKKASSSPYTTAFASFFDDELGKAFEQFPEYKVYLDELKNHLPKSKITQDYIIRPDFIHICICKIKECRKKYLKEKGVNKLFYIQQEEALIDQEIIFLEAVLKHERLKRAFQHFDETLRKEHLLKTAQEAMMKGMFSLIRPIIRLGIDSMSYSDIDFFIQNTIKISKAAIEFDEACKYNEEAYKDDAEEETAKEQNRKDKQLLEPLYEGSIQVIRELLTSVPLTPSSRPEYLSNGSCANEADRERFNQDVATMADVADSAIPDALQFYLVDLRVNPQLLVPQPDKSDQERQDYLQYKTLRYHIIDSDQQNYLPYQIFRYHAMDKEDRRWPRVAGCIRLLEAHKKYFKAWDLVDTERNKDRERLAGSLINCDTVKTFAAVLPDELWLGVKNMFWGSWWREFKEPDTAQAPQPPKQSPTDKLVSG